MDRQDQLSCDDFLGGRIRLWQPKDGYRAGIDPVLLAASVPVRPGEEVLELGCGVGTASLCLLSRVPDCRVTGVELQPDYAVLAGKNADQNAANMTVIESDLTNLPEPLRRQQFHHVMANPPFFDPNAHSAAQDAGRNTGRTENTPLDTWVKVAAKRLKPKGYLHMIHRMERLPDVLAACAGRLGSIEVLPIAARQNRAPHLMLLRARKEGRAPFTLHAPLILHNGDHHTQDGDSYRTDISNILRDGGALAWP